MTLVHYGYRPKGINAWYTKCALGRLRVDGGAVGEDGSLVAVLVGVVCKLSEDNEVQEDGEECAGDPARVDDEVVPLGGLEEDGCDVCDV